MFYAVFLGYFKDSHVSYEPFIKRYQALFVSVIENHRLILPIGYLFVLDVTPQNRSLVLKKQYKQCLCHRFICDGAFIRKDGRQKQKNKQGEPDENESDVIFGIELLCYQPNKKH